MELRCGRCVQVKPVTAFNKNGARKNRTGYDNYCRDCMREAARRREEERRGRPVPEEDRCIINGCKDRRKGHGFCNRHLKRYRAHGSPLAGREYGQTTVVPKRPSGLSLEESFRWFLPGEPPAEGVPWLWPGPVDEKGYGTIRFQGRNTFAHRISYELFVGPLPEGLVVRHKNDTPLDVNPHNLELGTLIDNVRDREERGRTWRGELPEESRAKKVRGESAGMSKLTEAHIHEIRRMATEGFSQTYIAKTFGITQSNVSAIVRRKTWAHVP